MNCNQNMQPAIEAGVIDEPRRGNGLAKIRRKLSLTFVISNPFRVPVAQVSANSAVPQTGSAKKMENGTV